MSRNIAVGIDVGTYQVKVVVAERDNSLKSKKPKIIGTGFAESRGLRHGYIVNSSETEKSLRKALEQAQNSSGMKIKKTYLSVGGIGLQSTTSGATIPVGRADSVITNADIEKVIALSEQALPASEKLNRRIIHPIPISFSIDGEEVLGEARGMKGKKLEVKTLFVTCFEKHLNDLIDVVNDLGVEVLDVVASPIAASLVTLTKMQKIAGVVLANIGSETVSIVVYENNTPISLAVFPIGSIDITHSIALGLKIPIEEAEDIKKGVVSDNDYPKKKLEDIIASKLSDIFDLIELHLKKIGRNALLPAGIVITGGGSALSMIDEAAKMTLKLPSRVAFFADKDGIKNASWSVAYGLCILGLNNEENENAGIKIVKPSVNSITRWFKQFLP